MTKYTYDLLVMAKRALSDMNDDWSDYRESTRDDYQRAYDALLALAGRAHVDSAVALAASVVRHRLGIGDAIDAALVTGIEAQLAEDDEAGDTAEWAAIEELLGAQLTFASDGTERGWSSEWGDMREASNTVDAKHGYA